MNLKEAYLRYIWEHKNDETITFQEWVRLALDVRYKTPEDTGARLWLITS